MARRNTRIGQFDLVFQNSGFKVVNTCFRQGNLILSCLGCISSTAASSLIARQKKIRKQISLNLTGRVTVLDCPMIIRKP